MGSGIAQVCAASGRKVWLFDVDPAGIVRAKDAIAKSASRIHQKGGYDDETLENVTTSITAVISLNDIPFDAIDVAIEAATENPELKFQIFSDLDSRLRPSALLLSNTSSISLTKLGAATSRAPLVAGMHFMNPVPMLELVEVIAGLESSSQTIDIVQEFARALGKTPVLSNDAPGFITNRLLMPMINEAFFCLQEGVGTPDAIDQAMKLGMKHPLGPLALADLVGLDTCLSICEVLHRELGEDKYRPCPLLRNYVAAGRLGRKSGRGVYEY
jgi:3-hydroxybutyryl-CoA dehydrogenase